MSIVLVALVGAFFCLGVIAVCIRLCTDDPSLVHMAIVGTNDNTAVTQISVGDGLDKEVIEKFPMMVYSEVKHLKIDKVQLECAVCLNEFKDYELLRLLTNCDHVFHPQCIDAWLASHVTCPVCRTNLTPQSDKLNDRVDVDIDVVVVEEQPGLSETNSRSIIREEQYQISANILNPNYENRSPRSTSYSDGKFLRSHSTGHSLVQINGNLEKYTLRVSDEVRKQIEINSQLINTKSRGIAVWPKEESSRIGYSRYGVDAVEGSSKTGILSPRYERSDRRTKSDRWVFTKARPFLSRGGSSRSPKCIGVGVG